MGPDPFRCYNRDSRLDSDAPRRRPSEPGANGECEGRMRVRPSPRFARSRDGRVAPEGGGVHERCPVCARIVRENERGVAACISGHDATFDVPRSRHIAWPGASSTDSRSVEVRSVRGCFRADEQTRETERREAHATADGVLRRVRLPERSCVGGLGSVSR